MTALVGLALALRALDWSTKVMMNNDGPKFLRLARSIESGDFAALWGHPYHPLYPFATYAAHLGVEAWDTAAALVSIAAGSAAVIPLYVLLRRTFDPEIAWIGGALLAVHPYAVAFSADVLSDALYLALFLGSAAALRAALSRSSPAAAALSAVLAGLAYLTRPEGVGVVIVGGALAAWLGLRGAWPPRQTLKWVGALALGALAVMGPYLGVLRAHHGVWMLTQKKSVSGLLGFGEVLPEPAASAESAEASGAMPGVDAGPLARSEAAPGRPAGRRGDGSEPVGQGIFAAVPDLRAPAEAAGVRAVSSPAAAASAPAPPRGAVERVARPARAAGGVRRAELAGEGSATGPPGADAAAAVAVAEAPVAAAGGPSSGGSPLRYLTALGQVLEHAGSTAPWELLPFFGVGAWVMRGRPELRGQILLVFLALYGVVLYGLALQAGYVSRRHTLPLVILSLGYAAVGLQVVGRAAARRLARRLPSARRVSPQLATAVLVGLLAVPALARSLGPSREIRRAERQAAEWVGERVREDEAVAARRERVAFYAQAPYVALGLTRGRDALAFLERRGVRYVIVEERKIDHYPELERAVDALRHRRSFEHAGREAHVFELPGPLPPTPIPAPPHGGE